MNKKADSKMLQFNRRDFLKASGLGVAGMLLANSSIGALAHDTEELGDTLQVATWPNYHNFANFDNFTRMTGVNINVSVFGSNEEMLARLQAGGTGWDVFVPTNYTIPTYVTLDLIEKLDMSLLPNFDESASSSKFLDEMRVEGEPDLWVVPKNWGTTGFVYNTNEIEEDITSWAQFFELAMGEYSGRAMVHDYQLTTIGAALNALGYSFNSIDPAEMAEAETLLLELKPHLFAITSDYQPAMRSGDAWMTICWNGDGIQLNRDLPEMRYVLGSEGGEIWVDTWAMVKDAPHRAAAYAFIDYMLNPGVAAAESVAHGYAQTDERATALLSEDMRANAAMYPQDDLIANLEFGADGVGTNEGRAELMARFKSS